MRAVLKARRVPTLSHILIHYLSHARTFMSLKENSPNWCIPTGFILTSENSKIL